MAATFTCSKNLWIIIEKFLIKLKKGLIYAKDDLV